MKKCMENFVGKLSKTTTSKRIGRDPINLVLRQCVVVVKGDACVWLRIFFQCSAVLLAAPKLQLFNFSHDVILSYFLC